MWGLDPAWTQIVKDEMEERGCQRKEGRPAWCSAHPLANGWGPYGCTAAEVWASQAQAEMGGPTGPVEQKPDDDAF